MHRKYTYLVLGLADEGEHLVQLGSGDEGPHAGVLQLGVPHGDGLGPLHHLLQELGQDLPLHVHSRTVATNLETAAIFILKND